MISYYCLSCVLFGFNELFGYKITYSVQTNNSIKVMNLISYKRNTKTNDLASGKTNRNTVLEIFGSFYEKRI